jgi:3-oxoacyl-[acyl-carrier-protein] synthase-3
MRFENVAILGLAHVDAPHRVTSREIEDRLMPAKERFGVNKDLIEPLTGIKERRFWDADMSFHEAAALAAEKVLDDTGLDRSRIGVITSTSVCKDYLEPSMACLIHGNLGLAPECMNFDIANACLAFINGMEMVGNMIDRGQVDYGLIVNGEGSRMAVEATIYKLLHPQADLKSIFDNFATLTLGSGSAAMILARADLAPDKPRVKGAVTLADTKGNKLCLGQPDCMLTDATQLLQTGLTLAKKTWDLAAQELGWEGDCLDHYIMHQIGQVHLRKFCQIVGISEDKVHKTFPLFGNIGPAAVPITLSKAVEAGHIQKGNRVGLMGIGSGVNCSMMEVVW